MAILAGIRSRLVLLACAVAAPMLGLQLLQAASGRQEALQRAKDHVSELARLIVAEHEVSLESGAELLRVLRHVPAISASELQVSPASNPVSTASYAQESCHALLRAVTNAHPRIDAITVTRADGQVQCTSAQPVPPAISMADRAWFQDATAPDAAGVVISSVLLSRISHLPSVIVAAPLSDAAPAKGAISAAMNLGWFSGFVAPVPDLAGVAIEVIDARDGAVLASSRGMGSPPAPRFADDALLESFRTEMVGQQQVNGLDGVERIIGFRRLPGDQREKAVVVVNIAVTTVLAAANHRLMQGLCVTGLMLVLGMAAAWTLASISITRPLDALGGVAQRLGQGDLAVRAPMPHLGVQEFRRLGEMFNAAVAQIELRDMKLEKLASQDGLTGLANRRLFDMTLAREWMRASRSGRPLALAMIDVDHFKRFNDTYGHPAGDLCLQTIASAISDSVRQASDLVARYGGEEFAVIIPETDADNALCLADRVVDAIRSLCLPHAGAPDDVVTISVGVAACQPTGAAGAPPDLTEAADRALYHAKRAGRGIAMAARDELTPLRPRKFATS